MQELKVNDHVTVKFDEEVVLVPQAQLEDLVNHSLLGRMWKIQDVAKQLGTSREWVRDQILNNPKFANEIGKLKVQGVVVKGPGRTSPWRFKATEFAKWLDQNMTRFNWDSTK